MALAALCTSASAAAATAPKVTIYSRDLGFVRETRDLDIAGPGDTVRIADLPERLDFSSVQLHAPGFAVRRLAYRYDLASGDGLLEQSRGSRVKVISRGDRTNEGVLLAADGTWLVVRGNDGVVTALSRTAVEDVRLTSPPRDVTLEPTLEVAVDGGKRERVPVELSYLTGGLSWSAEHVLVRNSETSGTWSASVAIDNQSGHEYRNATLKLVAGEPHRAGPPPRPLARGLSFSFPEAAAEKADLSQETFSEYHLYTLDRPATLRDKESQSLTMLTPRPVKLTPRYEFRGGPSVQAQLELRNAKNEGPGEPLAGGRVRIYEKDARGDLQFTGESQIRHTPVGEKMTVGLGDAFDLTGERRETANRRISDHEREVDVEVKLRNQKTSEVVIHVVESQGGDVEVTRKSHDFTRKDSRTLDFTVPVRPGQEAILTYTARIRC